MLGRGLRIVAAVTAVGCGGGSSTAPSGTNPGTNPGGSTAVASVTISPTTATLQVAETRTFTAVALSAAGAVLSGKTFTWSSSANGVASVSAAGVVTGVAAGSATISATSESISARRGRHRSERQRLGGAVFSKTQRRRPSHLRAHRGRKAYCWGDPTYGQIAGDLNVSSTPRAVAGNLTFTSISAGGTHTCALTAAGDAYCWGRNLFGELGDGSLNLRNSPVQVGGNIKFASVIASGEGGNTHSCGLTASGAAYCWGRNSLGQVGDNTTIDKSSPVAVAGGLTFTMIGLGGSHTCGHDWRQAVLLGRRAVDRRGPESREAFRRRSRRV